MAQDSSSRTGVCREVPEAQKSSSECPRWGLQCLQDSRLLHDFPHLPSCSWTEPATLLSNHVPSSIIGATRCACLSTWQRVCALKRPPELPRAPQSPLSQWVLRQLVRRLGRPCPAHSPSCTVFGNTCSLMPQIPFKTDFYPLGGSRPRIHCRTSRYN